MALVHFFLDDQVVGDADGEVFALRLAADDLRHACVLRLGAGEHIGVVDAAQDYFECEIATLSPGGCTVRITGRPGRPAARPAVVLVQGIAKGDKMEGIIRHATELGVAAFVPFAAERSIVRLDAKKAASRTGRWRAIAKSAAMQSGQPGVPEVCEPVALSEVCALFSQATAVLVCWEEAPLAAGIAEALARGLAACSCPAADARVAVVVGPEGGLARREVEALLACNARAEAVSLGPSILRTETAGLIAPALVLYELGCLGGSAPEGGAGRLGGGPGR